MSAYLTLNSKLTVQDPTTLKGVGFAHIASAEIKQSVVEIGDTADITIPRRYAEIKDKAILEHIKVGDKISLQLGYNGELHEEFSGYIREIGSGYPVVLYCDDQTYPLRKNTWTESWKDITLRELLTAICPGYKVECAEVSIGQFQIDNASTLQVLRELKSQYGFSSFLRDGTIHCQFAYDVRGVGNIHTYDFSRNVRRGKTNLKYKRKEDFNIRIKAISNLANGKKITVEVGSTDKDASLRTLNFRQKTESELRELATKELSHLVFDGFEGSVSGFGYPRVNAGDTLKLIDKREPERNGSYLVESVTIRYGNAFYERECKLSYKITGAEQ